MRGELKMNVKEIMSSVTKISADSTVSDAAKLMDEKNFGSVPIEEDGKVTGIITERDVLRKIVAKGVDPKTTSVKDIMTSPVITIGPEKSVEEANEIMTDKKIRRLPVESDGKVIGIVTLRDVSNSLRYSLGKRLIKSNDHPRPGY